MNAPEPSATSRLVRNDVYARLRDAILSCALAPGAQIHEQALAAQYKVSKSPIRDALLRLQEQSLVEVLPRRGYRVRPISVADAVEMYEMRELLERACVARAIDHASDAQLRALDAVPQRAARPRPAELDRLQPALPHRHRGELRQRAAGAERGRR